MLDLSVKCRVQAKGDHQEAMPPGSVPLLKPWPWSPRGLQTLLVSSVFPWGPRGRGCRSGREGAFLEPTPLSARGICFPRLGWKGPEASCRGRVYTPSNSSLPGMMPLLGAVIASSGLPKREQLVSYLIPSFLTRLRKMQKT